MIAVFLFSLSGVLVKSVSLAIHPMATTVGALTVSLPLFIMSWLLLDGSIDISTWESRSIWATIYLGVFGSLIGFFAYFFYVFSHLLTVILDLVQDLAKHISRY